MKSQGKVAVKSNGKFTKKILLKIHNSKHNANKNVNEL